MGVSIMGTSWSFRLSPKTQTPKFASSSIERDPISLNMRFGHPIKAHTARSLKCRSVSEDFVERSSPFEVKKELEICFDLIHRLGRGIVYLGSARIPPNHSHYLQAQELSREAANLLDCTTWSGAGPGLMDAVTKGALEAEKPVGGIKIEKEAGEWTASKFHPYLPPQNYHTCRFFSARKHGLVDAVIRNNVSDKTAVIALPVSALWKMLTARGGGGFAKVLARGEDPSSSYQRKLPADFLERTSHNLTDEVELKVVWGSSWMIPLI